MLGRVPCVGETVDGDRVLSVEHTLHGDHVAVVTLKPTYFRWRADFDGEVKRVLESGWKRAPELVYEQADAAED